jgi:hypothetical protein
MNDGMDSRRSIHAHRRPTTPVFVAQMDEQRVRVVLDAQPMGGVRLLVKPASLPSWE